MPYYIFRKGLCVFFILNNFKKGVILISIEIREYTKEIVSVCKKNNFLIQKQKIKGLKQGKNKNINYAIYCKEF